MIYLEKKKKKRLNAFSFYLYNAKRVLIKKSLLFRSDFGGLPGNRTPDTLIKSQVLYRLS